MICSSESFLNTWYHCFAGQYGMMTIAAAPNRRNFRTRSGGSVQGGLHHLVSEALSLSGRWRQSTASEVGSHKRELQRGSLALPCVANLSIE
jgi:hypothetical protein